MEINQKRDCQKAAAAGNRALQSLKNAQKELNSAKNWGIMDALGGGLLSTYVKRSKMKEAQSFMDEAKRDMQKFQSELNHICDYENLNVQTGDFLTFADYFLDSLFIDLLVQNQIQKAREQVEEAIRRVEQILTQMQRI